MWVSSTCSFVHSERFGDDKIRVRLTSLCFSANSLRLLADADADTDDASAPILCHLPLLNDGLESAFTAVWGCSVMLQTFRINAVACLWRKIQTNTDYVGKFCTFMLWQERQRHVMLSHSMNLMSFLSVSYYICNQPNPSLYWNNVSKSITGYTYTMFLKKKNHTGKNFTWICIPESFLSCFDPNS